jgi:hypothetical protein
MYASSNRSLETRGGQRTYRVIPVSADLRNMHMATVATMSAVAPKPFAIPARI